MDYCFFFKHKTAYEMRISDWSSDVCSSDLLRPGVTAAIARAESLPLSPNRAIVFTALQHYKGNILFRVTSTDSIVMALADRPFDEARRYMVLTQLRPNKDIGRASCREGVRQYVKFSEVGDSLKKKKKK